jgi:methyltransferase (TIGR00027 family)
VAGSRVVRGKAASRTAKAVALWRALGDMGVTTVPHFSDPVARRLLDGPFWAYLLRRAEALAVDPRSEAATGIRPWVDAILLRVAFLDAAVADARARQVVVLGAGLDTRAWRLDALRGVRVFEVDHPATQAYKREKAANLAPPLAELTFVPVDFTRDDLASALRSAGHDPAAPTVWVWEGVVMYLDDDALRGTLRAVRALSAPGSTLLAHYHEPDSTRSKTFRSLVFAWIGEPQIGLRSREVMRDEVTRAGFQVVEDAGLPEQAARVGADAATASGTRLKVSRILVARV